MKNLMLLVISFGFNLTINAQTVEWTNNLVDCMYTGLDNVLPLKFVDVELDKLELSVSAGEIKKNEAGQYTWKSLTSTGTEQTLFIKAGGKLIGEYKMKFVRIPDPVVGLLPDSNATVKTMTGIKGILPGTKLNIPVTVQSYDIKITVGNDITTFQVKGSSLSKNQRTDLKNVKSDAQVLITNVIVRCPGDKAGRRIGDLRLQ